MEFSECKLKSAMFTRGGRSLRGRPQTIRHREAASSEKTSGGTTDLANRMQRLLVDEKLQDVTFSVGEVILLLSEITIFSKGIFG